LKDGVLGSQKGGTSRIKGKIRCLGRGGRGKKRLAKGEGEKPVEREKPRVGVGKGKTDPKKKGR